MSRVARWAAPVSFVVLAVALYLAVWVLEVVGFDSSVAFLSGQFDPDGVSATMFRGGLYVVVWLTWCVVGPSLLLSAGLYGVWNAVSRR